MVGERDVLEVLDVLNNVPSSLAAGSAGEVAPCLLEAVCSLPGGGARFVASGMSFEVSGGWVVDFLGIVDVLNDLIGATYFELSFESKAVLWSGTAAGIDGALPGKLVGLGALLWLVVDVAGAAAAGGVLAGRMFSGLRCSEVATFWVGTLGIGAWLDILGTSSQAGS